MDKDIARSLEEAPLTDGNFPLFEIGLGIFTPSKDSKVGNIKTFQFDKASNKIVQEKTKKLLVVGRATYQ